MSERKFGKTNSMVIELGQINNKPVSKTDLCRVCGKGVMVNVVLCRFWQNLIHGKHAKVKMVNSKFAMNFKCSKCKMFQKITD